MQLSSMQRRKKMTAGARPSTSSRCVGEYMALKPLSTSPSISVFLLAKTTAFSRKTSLSRMGGLGGGLDVVCGTAMREKRCARSCEY